MIEPDVFANKQLVLAGEFGKYVFEHPEIDDVMPDGAYVYFHVEGEEAFNEYSRSLAEYKQREGVPVVLVRVKGLAPLQGSRLIEPVIEPTPAGV
jgi:hypothetical protein